MTNTDLILTIRRETFCANAIAENVKKEVTRLDVDRILDSIGAANAAAQELECRLRNQPVKSE